MAKISVGLKKRGNKYMFEGNYSGAVDCFFRAYMIEPDDIENIADLICALNSSGEFIYSLCYCYAMLGQYSQYIQPDDLYFLLAEVFGSTGCAEACAKMLEKCIKENPDGAYSKDSYLILKDIKEKYDIGKIDTDTNEVIMPLPNMVVSLPFADGQTMVCMQEVNEYILKEKYTEAIDRLEDEFKIGNASISLLSVAILLGAQTGDKSYIKRNAERFRFVDDYTKQELNYLAYNLTELDDADTAYTVYNSLYMKDYSEKEISFGYAVACEKIGNISRAKEIASKITNGDGSKGPAGYYIENIGNCAHSYALRYEGEVEKRILAGANDGYKTNYEIYEALDYVSTATIDKGMAIINSLDANEPFVEFELRKCAINPNLNLMLRACAASKIKDDNVYLNTGCEIVKYTPEMGKVINSFFERGIQYESVN